MRAKATDPSCPTLLRKNDASFLQIRLMNFRLISLLAVLALPAAAEIISPDGSLYTNVQSQAAFANFPANNLFDQNLAINDDPGSGSDSGRSWAQQNTSSPAVVSFQLDQAYDISGFVYAQREFNSNSSSDKSPSVDIWVSDTTPFGNTVPTTLPFYNDIPLDVFSRDIFKLYRFRFPVSARYFCFAFANTANGAVGGAELRLTTNTDPLISQDGSRYTNISANSEFSSSFRAANLFDQNLNIGDDPGSGSDANRSWAVRSTSFTAVIAFELDQVYDISALVYAQRQFNQNSTDKMGAVRIWASETTPFTTANPGTPATVPYFDLFTNIFDSFVSYDLEQNIRGRYFRMEFQQAHGSSLDAPGGSELRFRGSPAPSPDPTVTSISYLTATDQISLTYNIPTAGQYQLERSTTLAPNSWIRVANGGDLRNVQGNGTYTSPTGIADKAFYRIAPYLAPQF